MPGMKGFPFLGDELFHRCVILLKPVLVFSGLVPKNGFAGSKDLSRLQCPSLSSVYSCWRLSQERPEVAVGWQSPRCLKLFFLAKDSVSDGEVVLSRLAEKHYFFRVDVPNAFLSYSSLLEVLIPANPGRISLSSLGILDSVSSKQV